ncbi:MAG: preprotein translocase subunit SecG, partial [Thermoguttaceae bacterium]|nr:preprotein translocase subunit SecG [Thermoguttaceae bacterium]
MITFFQGLLYTVLMLLCLFMILIILLQRGKGGGLVGAFGGLGGSSAFGAKTGDVFMKITIYATFLWFLLCLGGRY